MKRSNKRRTGYKGVTGTYMTYLRRKAKERGLEFNVSPEYIWELFVQQNGKCALSGVDIILSTKIDKHNNVDRSEHTASLDRIDNTKPYEEGNLQWVHKTINWMRRQYTVEEYINWCSLVHKHANPEPSQPNDNNCRLEGATTNERGMSTDKFDTSVQHPAKDEEIV